MRKHNVLFFFNKFFFISRKEIIVIFVIQGSYSDGHGCLGEVWPVGILVLL